MKKHSILAATVGAAVTLTLLPQISFADTITIDRDTVIPVSLDSELNVKESRRGDRFTATVRENVDLPRGTRLVGRVTDVQKKRKDRPAYIDLEFYQVELPDGTTSGIKAFPIALNEKNVRRDNEGRFRAGKNVVRREQWVLGSTIGGLIIGTIFKEPFGGAAIGALAGIVLAEAARDENETVVLKKGTKLGALFDRRVTLDYRGSRNDRWTRDEIDEIDERDDRGYWQKRRDENGSRGPDYGRRGEGRDDDGIVVEDDDRWEEGRHEIRFRDRALTFRNSEQPYRQGDVIMVPLLRTADQLDLDVDGKDEDEIFFLEDQDSILKLELNSKNYRLNGKRGTLSRAVVRRDGVVFVPIEVLAGMKSERILVDGTKVDPLT